MVEMCSQGYEMLVWAAAAISVLVVKKWVEDSEKKGDCECFDILCP